MNLEEYQKLPNGIIVSGFVSNSPTGVFMTRDENLPILRYVIVKNDYGWRGYVGFPDRSEYSISMSGDTIPLSYIRTIFNCSDEVFIKNYGEEI